MRKFHRMPERHDDLQVHLNLNTASQAGPFVFDGLQGEGYRLPTLAEWKMGASFAEPTQWNYDTAAGMAHRVPSSVLPNRLADYWGNVSEMLWEGGDKGDCIGGSANSKAYLTARNGKGLGGMPVPLGRLQAKHNKQAYCVQRMSEDGI